MSHRAPIHSGKILLATTNRGKLREFRSLLSGSIPESHILSLSELQPADPPAETGDTFLENARIKARYYSIRSGGVFVIAEDSGLVVPVLNGEPGIRSARYAGPHATDSENMDHLLVRLEGKSDRSAFFFTAASVALDGEIVFECRGRVDGEILETGRGENGFGYDPLFFHPGLNRSFAQIGEAEKNRVSHRGRAMIQVRDFLLTLLE